MNNPGLPRRRPDLFTSGRPKGFSLVDAPVQRGVHFFLSGISRCRASGIGWQEGSPVATPETRTRRRYAPDMTTLHHRNLREEAPGVWLPLRPARDTSRWHRWRRERACRREIGHCWHPDSESWGWFCCECGGDTEGHPPQECVHCLAEQPTAGTVTS